MVSPCIISDEAGEIRARDSAAAGGEKELGFGKTAECRIADAMANYDFYGWQCLYERSILASNNVLAGPALQNRRQR